MTFDFVDDDLGSNSIVTVKTVKDRTANVAGSATNVKVTTTWYQRWTYDSGDNFGLDIGGDDVAATVNAATMAQFETENASLTAHTTDMTVVYRIAAAGTGVSYFVTGT